MLRGMTECWREELRRHNVRVTLVNPSEVQTPFFGKAGLRQEPSPRKLRPKEIADAVVVLHLVLVGNTYSSPQVLRIAAPAIVEPSRDGTGRSQSVPRAISSTRWSSPRWPSTS